MGRRHVLRAAGDVVTDFDQTTQQCPLAHDLQQRLAAARERYVAAAKLLTQGRQKAATALDRKVTGFMQALGMPGGIFATVRASQFKKSGEPA